MDLSKAWTFNAKKPVELTDLDSFQPKHTYIAFANALIEKSQKNKSWFMKACAQYMYIDTHV